MSVHRSLVLLWLYLKILSFRFCLINLVLFLRNVSHLNFVENFSRRIGRR